MAERFTPEAVRRKARRRGRRGPDAWWFSLGTAGLVGWSVALPTLFGAGLGIWLDQRHPGRFSWTLMLLTLGVLVGSLTAWQWVRREECETFPEEKERDA